MIFNSAFAPFIQGPGLSIGVLPGVVLVGSNSVQVPKTALSLTANTTSYVYLNTSTGVIVVNTTGFPGANAYPIATVVTSSTGIQSLIDNRADIAGVGSGGGGGIPGATLYVDGSRTDSYAQTGAIGSPFKTIAGAVNQIVSNGNSQTVPYRVSIAPGSYNEAIALNLSAIYNVNFDGGQSMGTGIDGVPANCGVTVTGLTTSNPLAVFSPQQLIAFNGIQFNGNITVSGATTSNPIFSMLFNSCFFGAYFSSTFTFTFDWIGELNFFNCNFGNSGAQSLVLATGDAVNMGSCGGICGVTLNSATTLFNYQANNFPGPLTISDSGSFVYIYNSNGVCVDSAVSVTGFLEVNNSLFGWSSLTINSGGIVNINGSAQALSSSAFTFTNSGTFTAGGPLVCAGLVNSIRTVASNYAIVPYYVENQGPSADGTILANGAITITLPTTKMLPGQIFRIKNITSSSTVTVSSSVNIDTATTKTLTTMQAIAVQWDGTQYWILSSH